MENRAHALAAGAFVTVVLALLIGLATWLTRSVTNTITYELATQYAVNGLQEQAPVRYKGVTVGKVTRISLDEKDPGTVKIELAVLPKAPVTRATYAQLGFQGVTGLAYIQLDDDGKAKPSDQQLSQGQDGSPPRIPFRVGLLGELGDQAQNLITQINTTVGHLNHLLADENGATLSQTLGSMNDAAKSIASLASSLQESTKPLTAQTSRTLLSLKKTSDRAGSSLAELNTLSVALEQSVKRVAGPGGVIDSVGNSANALTTQTLPHLNQLTLDARSAAQQIDRAAQSITDNPQSLLYGNAALAPGPGESGFKDPLPLASKSK